MSIKICPICGARFESSKKNKKYCSEVCQKKANVDFSAARYKRIRTVTNIAKCEWCGKTFTREHNKTKYCSDECRHGVYQDRLKKYAEKRKLMKVQKSDSKIETICWKCQNACGGCSWSRRLEPVKGWKAERVVNKDIYDTKFKSYKVIECPEFKEGR